MKTLGMILGGKSCGVFKNEANEHCRISRYYIKNTQYFEVIFSGIIGVMATRPTIKTTSEKKVLKFLEVENFKLEE